jgi:hypothetical protein
MAEGDGPSLVPSSLSPDAAAAKSGIENWMGDRSSPYYVGTGELSADSVQAHYRDLVRGELAGAADAVGVGHEPDLDMPLHVGAYDIAAAPGARSMDAAGRALVDQFLPVAFAAHLGQRKVAQAIGFVLTYADPPQQAVRTFTDFAHGLGWSQQAIDVCLKFYNSLIAGRGAAPAPARDVGGRFAGAPSPSMIAERKAEIEGLMYIDGMPNPSYFGGPLEVEYRKLLNAELNGG